MGTHKFLMSFVKQGKLSEADACLLFVVSRKDNCTAGEIVVYCSEYQQVTTHLTNACRIGRFWNLASVFMPACTQNTCLEL